MGRRGRGYRDEAGAMSPTTVVCTRPCTLQASVGRRLYVRLARNAGRFDDFLCIYPKRNIRRNIVRQVLMGNSLIKFRISSLYPELLYHSWPSWLATSLAVKRGQAAQEITFVCLSPTPKVFNIALNGEHTHLVKSDAVQAAASYPRVLRTPAYLPGPRRVAVTLVRTG